MFAEDRNNAGFLFMCDALACKLRKMRFFQKARSRAPGQKVASQQQIKMGDAANAHQRNIYNKKIPTLEYVDGQVR